MKRRLIVAAAFILIASAIGGAAQRRLILKPAMYDPFGTRTVKAEWVRGIGLPDDAGTSSYGFRLRKSGPLSAREMALGELRGVTNLPLTALAFDVNLPGGPTPPSVRCSLVSPRFQVIARDRNGFLRVHALGCAEAFNVGTPAAGWTTLEFFFEEFPPLAIGAILQRVTIMFDEPGEVVLDNIRVNDIVITKPGFTAG